MIGWLKLTEEQRKAVINEAEQLSGINAKAIEKDWWVTLTLKALFQSKYCEFIVFKGGTSLSKSWNLIARFSEDIDIALDPKAFDMKYIDTPSGNYLKMLRKRGCEFTSNELLNELKIQLSNLGVSNEMISVLSAPIPEDRPDTDPQTLFVKYPSLYEKNAYIAEEVKIEVSVRSLKTPFTAVEIQSLLNAKNPKPFFDEKPFAVEAVEAKKTFLEKIFLLHEEFAKPDKTKIRTERMSRHLYDLYKIMNTQIGAEALADHELYANLIKHRREYSKFNWFNYDTLHHTMVSFIPPRELHDDYRKDYETMQEQMIYEETVSFPALIAALKVLQAKLRLKHDTHSVDELFEAAKKRLMDSAGFNKEEGRIYSTQITYPAQNELTATKNTSYMINLLYTNGQILLESIILQDLN